MLTAVIAQKQLRGLIYLLLYLADVILIPTRNKKKRKGSSTLNGSL